MKIKIINTVSLEVASGLLANPKFRTELPVPSIYHALFALKGYSGKPEELLGYFSLGPILYAFARYICYEVKKLQEMGKESKIIFLMRDAYLPALACKKLLGIPLGSCLEISRFNVIAASLQSKQDILNYFVQFHDVFKSTNEEFEIYCRQLLLPESLAKDVIAQANNSQKPRQTFYELILQPDILAIVYQNSSACRHHLKKYIQNTLGSIDNLSVILVDLATTGTTQRFLNPILLEMGAKEVLGYYLISKERPEWQKDCNTFLSPIPLLENFSIIEALCNSLTPSVAHFSQSGEPIYSTDKISATQKAKVKLIQDHCLNFIEDAKLFFNEIDIVVTKKTLQQMTLMQVMRQMYFLTKQEYAYLSDFYLDDNYTNKLVPMFENSNTVREDFIRNGLHFDRKNLFVLRHLLSLNQQIGLMTFIDRKLEFYKSDFESQIHILSVQTSHGQTIKQDFFETIPSIEGFLILRFDLGNPTGKKLEASIEIFFGERYRLIQIENIALINSEMSLGTLKYSYQNMQKCAENIYECLSHKSSLKLDVAVNYDDTLKIIFRPLEIL